MSIKNIFYWFFILILVYSSIFSMDSYNKFLLAQKARRYRRVMNQLKEMLGNTFKGIVRQLFTCGPNKGRFRVDIDVDGKILKDVMCDLPENRFRFFGIIKKQRVNREDIHVGSIVRVSFNRLRWDILDARGPTVQDEQEMVERLKKQELAEDIKDRMAFMLEEAAARSRVGKISLFFEDQEMKYPKLPIYELPKEKILLKKRKEAVEEKKEVEASCSILKVLSKLFLLKR